MGEMSLFANKITVFYILNCKSVLELINPHFVKTTSRACGRGGFLLRLDVSTAPSEAILSICPKKLFSGIILSGTRTCHSHDRRVRLFPPRRTIFFLQLLRMSSGRETETSSRKSNQPRPTNPGSRVNNLDPTRESIHNKAFIIYIFLCQRIRFLIIGLNRSDT